MNKCIFMGRLTKDPEVRYGGDNNTCIASFSLAVDRRFKREGQPDADFFDFTAFGKTGEFVEKYLHKGTKVVVDAEAQNNNYNDKNGNKQYRIRFVVNSIEFAESKKASQQNQQNGSSDNSNDDFIPVPESGVDSDLPFA